MKVLSHHIYEYKKGLRNLVLHTMYSSDVKLAEEKLLRHSIAYFIQLVTPQKINIFFGKEQCVKIIQSFNKKSLTDFSDEEDFMLGIMLGYDRMQQCDRYIEWNKERFKQSENSEFSNQTQSMVLCKLT